MNKLYSLLLSFFFLHSLFAQQATTSSSGTGQAGNIIFDWSVGELTLVNTVRNGALTLTQGLLQGTLIASPPFGGITLGELLIFPNPTSGLINLQIGFFEPGTLTLLLYDDQGKLLQQRSETINSFSNKTMSLDSYAQGLYMLHAVFTSNSGKPRKQTYKILKFQ